MIKWSISLAAGCAVALFASCERHGPEVLDKLPGHPAEHGEEHEPVAGEKHADDHEGAAMSEHAAADHAAPPSATEAKTPPKYFND